MTKKHPIQAYFEQQEAQERLPQERQRGGAQALERQRLKEAWTAVLPAIAEAVARANEALTPYSDERFSFSYSPSHNTATISISLIVSLRARNNFTILALRRALSMVTLSRRKSGKRPGAGGIASVPLRASGLFFPCAGRC